MDGFNSTALLPDGGVIAVGATCSDDGEFPRSHATDSRPTDCHDAVVAQFSASGSMVWARVYGGTGDDFFSSVAVASDGTIYAVGSTTSADGDFVAHSDSSASSVKQGAALVVKFSSSGDIIWAKLMGGEVANSFTSVAVTPDGDVVAGGNTFSSTGDLPKKTGAASSPVLVKLTGAGTLVWADALGGTGVSGFGDSLMAIAVGPSGDVVVVGASSSDDGDFPREYHVNSASNASFSDAFIASISADGLVDWSRVFGGTSVDISVSVSVTPAGDVYVAGSTWSSDGDFRSQATRSDGQTPFVACFSAGGTMAWIRTYVTDDDTWFKSIAALSDGGAVVAGFVNQTPPAQESAVSLGAVMQIGSDGAVVGSGIVQDMPTSVIASVTVANASEVFAAGMSSQTAPSGDIDGTNINWDALITKFNL